MRDILAAAIEQAESNYVRAHRKADSHFTGDLSDISATKIKNGLCGCRGMCGSHTGPCTMKASTGSLGAMPASAGKKKMCKTCFTAMSHKDKTVAAGGPGSGRHKEFNQAMKLSDKHMGLYKQHMKLGNDKLASHHGDAANAFDNAAKHFSKGNLDKGNRFMQRGLVHVSKAKLG